MTLVYDTEELTVTRRVASFSVRGRTGRVVSGLLLGEDRTALLTEAGDFLLY